MSRRAKYGLVFLSIFTLGNLLGAGFAAVAGEGLHAAVHAALLFLGVYFIRRIARRSRRDDQPHSRPPDEILDHLQQSVDAVALEVERIGEAQRFAVKLQQERTGTQR